MRDLFALVSILIIGICIGFIGALLFIDSPFIPAKHIYMSSETREALEEGISKEFIQVDSITSDYNKIYINLKNNEDGS